MLTTQAQNSQSSLRRAPPQLRLYNHPTPPHFTGKERDTESGNDYFGARYYASSMGRFLSPDWDEQPVPVPYADLPNPQSLNLYSYVRNNPMSRADADGHCDDDGGKHGTLWCIAHAIGLVESDTEKSQRIENERAWMLRNLGHKDGSPLTDAERNAISGASQDQIDKFHWQLSVHLTADDIKAGAASLAGVLTTPMAISAAKSLGFRRVNVDWDTHGQAVYEKDGRYISPDKDSHSGGVWKEFDRQGNRVGTLDANLNKIGK
jgi:RHS repeat-associated protein